MAQLSDWLLGSEDSPLLRFTPAGADIDSIFDVKVVYRQDYTTINLNDAPAVFRPACGEFGLMDYQKVYTALEGNDIFAQRGISDEGAIVIVRPDMYVANVLPLQATDALRDFFTPVMREQR